MKLVDLIVVGILIAFLILLFYLTRNKSKDGKCSGCHDQCSSCNAFKDFYKEYKDDQHE